MSSGGGAFDIKVEYQEDVQAAYNGLIKAGGYTVNNIIGNTSGENGYIPKQSPYWDYKHNTTLAERLIYGFPLGSQPLDRYPSIDDAMFTEGYTISSYPSLWDMYGKFVAGLDVEVIYEQIYEDMVNDPAINKAIAAESVYLDDELNRTSLPKLTAGMRDMNAVMSSSFIYGKALLESDKVKMINKFSADLKIEAMRLALQRWSTHLQWNHNVIEQYIKMNETFWSLRQSWTDQVIKIETGDKKWPLEVLDIYRACVGALNGAAAAQQGPTPPKWQQITSNVMGFAGMAGGMMGGGK